MMVSILGLISLYGCVVGEQFNVVKLVGILLAAVSIVFIARA